MWGCVFLVLQEMSRYFCHASLDNITSKNFHVCKVFWSSPHAARMRDRS
jgi:hypothetical protein